MTICCATWNVAVLSSRVLLGTDEGGSPPLNLSVWLLQDMSPADIYAVALQEIVDLNVVNVVLAGSASDEMSGLWTTKIESTLNSTGVEYSLLIERHAVGLVGAVFVKKALLEHIRDVRSSVVYTGGYGTTGNKGGIAIRCDVYDSPVCFVMSHFHANRNNVATRNLDYQSIMDNTLFPPSGGSKDKDHPKLHTNEADFGQIYHSRYKEDKLEANLNISFHEQIYWLGDLNYRIGGNLSEFDIFRLVDQGDWPTLIEADQVNL